MTWLFYLLLFVPVVYAVFTVIRSLRYEAQLKSWSRDSEEEWKEIQAMAKDPSRHDEMVERFIEKAQDQPPRLD
jgi:hypothetical protein